MPWLPDSPKPRLLDLFCGAGGAAVGYARAGFEVVGVDIRPQPHYPFEFWQRDVFSLRPSDLKPFDAVHASPPCQFITDYKRTGNVPEHENRIPETRHLLALSGRPYVIENVEKAEPWLYEPVMLCGSMFNPPLDVKRHRLFETSGFRLLDLPVLSYVYPLCCRHKLWADNRYPGATNRKGRRTVEVGVWRIPLETQKRAMGVDWDVTLEELSEMVPPAYTELIGHQLMQHVRSREAA